MAQGQGPGQGARKAPRVRTALTEVDGPPLADDVVDSLLRGDYTGAAREQLVVEKSRIVVAQFTASTCSRMRLTDVVAENSDFSGTEFDESSFTRVEFRDCRMSGALFTRCSLRDVLFSGCRINEANFRMSETVAVTFEGTDLRGSDFYGADLSGTRFFDCDLTGVEFSKAKLPGARFSGSKLDGLKGGLALAGAVIDSTQVSALALGLLSELNIGIDDEREGR